MVLTDNTTALEALRDQALALPDAGSGGGGGAPETCTVNVTNKTSSEPAPGWGSGYVVYIDPATSAEVKKTSACSFTIEKGSPLVVCSLAAITTPTNATMLDATVDQNFSDYKVYQILGDCEFAVRFV